MTTFGFLSSYPPTRCGLATFTESLASAMTIPGQPDARIVRSMGVLDVPAAAPIGTRSTVVAELTVGDRASIASAARALNAADVAIVQHEYGIYGGTDGDDVIRVLERLRVPVIVVLHTVLADPTEGQREVLERVVELASAVVVMTEAALLRLADGYRIGETEVDVIPHGVAGWTVERPEEPREDRRAPLILTWGLIGPGKGIERGIRALADLADLNPAPEYVVVGQTHPKVLAESGEAYRDGLVSLAAECGVAQTVTIDGRYLDAAQLAAHVREADVVLLPYDSRVQVTSGVLVEALAAGKSVVATAFPHAMELLSGGDGRVVDHDDHTGMVAAIRSAILSRPSPVADGEERVRFALETSWPIVAARYRSLAQALVAERAA